MAAFTAASAQRVANPEIVNRPPSGVELLATNGAVTNSMYYNLNLVWKPVQELSFKFGYLDVWLIAPLSDLYLSTVKGGVPVNAYGREYPGKHFGREYDFAIESELYIVRGLKLRAGIQGGIFTGGSALKSPDGAKTGFPSQVYKVECRLSLIWK